MWFASDFKGNQQDSSPKVEEVVIEVARSSVSQVGNEHVFHLVEHMAKEGGPCVSQMPN